jgi:hypothetical protein
MTLLTEIEPVTGLFKYRYEFRREGREFEIGFNGHQLFTVIKQMQ